MASPQPSKQTRRYLTTAQKLLGEKPLSTKARVEHGSRGAGVPEPTPSEPGAGTTQQQLPIPEDHPPPSRHYGGPGAARWCTVARGGGHTHRQTAAKAERGRRVPQTDALTLRGSRRRGYMCPQLAPPPRASATRDGGLGRRTPPVEDRASPSVACRRLLPPPRASGRTCLGEG